MGVSFRCKKFMLSDASTIPSRIDAHIHLYHEFLYFEQGDASYISGSFTHQLSPGDIIVTKPNVVHAISFASNARYSRIFIQISPHMLSSIPGELTRNLNGRFSNDSYIIQAQTTKKLHLHWYFHKGALLLSNTNEKNIYLAELLFSRFAIEANAAISYQMDRSGKIQSENNIVKSIKNYIDENYISEISLDELGKIFFISKYSICHMFKAETGITILDYLSLKRISAVQEHISSGKKLSDIYRICGFKDYSTFYRTVKKYTGMNPSDFYSYA